jgi:hypothetical protein
MHHSGRQYENHLLAFIGWLQGRPKYNEPPLFTKTRMEKRWVTIALHNNWIRDLSHRTSFTLMPPTIRHTLEPHRAYGDLATT